ETPTPVGSIVLDCPPQLEALVAQLLAKDPADRPADAAAVALRLKDIDQSVSIKMSRKDRTGQLAAAAAAPVETMTADVSSTAGPANRPLAAALAVALVGITCLIALLGSRTQPFQRSESLLVAALHDSSIPVRTFAIRTLGDIGPDAEGAVTELLGVIKSDIDPQVRAEAATALGKIGPGQQAVMAPLTAVQKNDEFPQVREAAGKAIEQMRNHPGGSHWIWWISAVPAIGVLVVGGLWGWRKLSA
ncbi:MAG: HEAT repeat domain-containing protein, partial [Planctomycetaceae bacterium]|nr:HEAT repeat domain-containing protein [Planctomycetaceae bacterium]